MLRILSPSEGLYALIHTFLLFPASATSAAQSVSPVTRKHLLEFEFINAGGENKIIISLTLEDI